MTLKTSNSPFNETQVELLNQVLPTLTPEQSTWLNGYLSALSVLQPEPEVAEAPPAVNAKSAYAMLGGAGKDPVIVTVLYGSQTGNSQGLAKEMASRLEDNGFQATLSSMSDYKPRHLKTVKTLLIVVSTHGEGVPPDNALSFHEFLHGKRAPSLDEVHYSVLALGDRSYDLFCQTGREFDQQLEALGGQRLFERVECDVDFEADAERWMQGVMDSLREQAGLAAPAPAAVETATAAPTATSTYSRSNPFQAEILENINLNGHGSDKETRHLELSIEGSDFEFKPGDSLGIYPENHPELVQALMDEMGWKEDELVKVGDRDKPLHEALARDFELTVLTKPLMRQAAEFSQNGLRTLTDPEKDAELKDYAHGRDVVDLVRDYKLQGVPAKEFVNVFRKIPPRLYSIANSFQANPDEVHVAIAAVRYQANGRNRFGVCSIQSAERLNVGDRLPVFIQHNDNFRMPEDLDATMIMVGPGTGVAPFRAFLEEREELDATGKNWLFFGDRRFRTDFMYQLEWQRYLKDGLLTNLDVAFSRDTDQKVYVQHKLLAHSEEIFDWLEDGAYFYVCGDEKHMAPDVHKTLETIVAREGDMDTEKAKEYIANLQKEHRYQRDVY